MRDIETGRFLPAIKFDKDFLIDEYVIKRKSMMVISEENHTSYKNVKKQLQEYDIELRLKGEWKRGTGRDLTNQTFGKLFVVGRKISKTMDRWICKCECGREYVCNGHNLVHEGLVECRECFCPRLGTDIVPQVFWTELKKGANARNLVVSIDIHYLSKLYKTQNGKCAISGVEIVFAQTNNDHKIRRLTTASLDRINPNYGYIENNVQFIHKSINLMKHKMQQDEMINWCLTIADYQRSQPL